MSEIGRSNKINYTLSDFRDSNSIFIFVPFFNGSVGVIVRGQKEVVPVGANSFYKE